MSQKEAGQIKAWYNNKKNSIEDLQAAVSPSIEEIDNVLDGLVSLIIGSFKFAPGGDGRCLVGGENDC